MTSKDTRAPGGSLPSPDLDRGFSGSIAQLYDRYMVPLIFEPYAVDLAARVAQLEPSNVLEIAAGTGAVTRRLARALAAEVSIIATDLAKPMLDQAAAVGTCRPVEWRQADGTQLPFADETFDAVVCQFAVMFFPDKPKAFAEARRVLRRGGVYIFNVWDSIDHNEFAQTVESALGVVFPDDPPRFMSRIPHGYSDADAVTRDLAAGGFSRTRTVATITERSRAPSAEIAAVAYCQGTPFRSEIEARDPARLTEATRAAADALGERFGRDAIDAKIQAHIFVVEW